MSCPKILIQGMPKDEILGTKRRIDMTEDMTDPKKRKITKEGTDNMPDDGNKGDDEASLPRTPESLQTWTKFLAEVIAREILEGVQQGA